MEMGPACLDDVCEEMRFSLARFTGQLQKMLWKLTSEEEASDILELMNDDAIQAATDEAVEVWDNSRTPCSAELFVQRYAELMWDQFLDDENDDRPMPVEFDAVIDSRPLSSDFLAAIEMTEEEVDRKLVTIREEQRQMQEDARRLRPEKAAVEQAAFEKATFEKARAAKKQRENQERRSGSSRQATLKLDPGYPETLSTPRKETATLKARRSDLMATMSEALQQRTEEMATYTHIECKIGGLERAAMGIYALTDWLKDHRQDSVTYMFVNDVDHGTALSNIEYEGEVVTTDGADQGKLFATTYLRWVQQGQELDDNQGKLVFVMDMGFGVRTGEMALAATTLLHNLQGLLRGEKTGTNVLWISVSYSDEALLCDKSGRLVNGLLLPHFNEPRLCNKDKAHEKADGPQRPDKDWQSAAAGQILQEVIKDATLPMAIAFVMSIEDAYVVRNELAVSPQCPSPVLHFIHPWTDSQAAREAVASSQGLKIVYVDPEVSVVGAIHNLKAVVVAPALNAYYFDINTTSVVKKKVVCDLTAALASSIQGSGLEGAAVRIVKGFSHPMPVPNRRLIRSKEQAELSTASDRDFWYLSLASHAISGDYAFPGLLSAVVTPKIRKLSEAARRLDLWHLVDRSDLPPGVDPRSPRLLSQLVDPVAQFATVESNIHSLVLMAHAKRDLPIRVKHVLIDLAMLISQGPHSVFDYTGKVRNEREHRGVIQGLDQQAGFAKKHCHKGLIWQAIAYLNCFRRLMAGATWGPKDWATSKLGGVARYDVLATLSERISLCKRAFNLPMEDQTARLPSEEFEVVEAILVSAFPFNLMIVHVEDVGYFGWDATSEVILKEEAQGETVYWKALKEKAKKSGREIVMAIYSHLWMDTDDDDDLRVYRAIGVTGISESAFKKGLKYLGIDDLSSLRPVIRPDRRCLIPKGQSWSGPLVTGHHEH